MLFGFITMMLTAFICLIQHKKREQERKYHENSLWKNVVNCCNQNNLWMSEKNLLQSMAMVTANYHFQLVRNNNFCSSNSRGGAVARAGFGLNPFERQPVESQIYSKRYNVNGLFQNLLIDVLAHKPIVSIDDLPTHMLKTLNVLESWHRIR